METCPTCGSKVKVVGHTTKHYVPVDYVAELQKATIELWNIIREVEELRVRFEKPSELAPA